MWRNLAKVQSTIKTIGNVVAPPMSDDEEEDDYFSEDDHYYVDEHSNYSQVHETRSSSQQLEQEGHPVQSLTLIDKDNSDNKRRRRGFGFVGLLAQALDAEQKEFDDSHREEEEEDDDEEEKEEEEEEEEEVQFDDDEVVHGGFTQSSGPLLVPHMLLQTLGPAAQPSMISERDQESSSKIAEAERVHGQASDGGVIPPKDYPSERSTISEQMEKLPDPRRLGLVRESGSVSPFNSPQSVKSASKIGRSLVSGLPSMPEEEKGLHVKLAGNSDGEKNSKEPDSGELSLIPLEPDATETKTILNVQPVEKPQIEQVSSHDPLCLSTITSRDAINSSQIQKPPPVASENSSLTKSPPSIATSKKNLLDSSIDSQGLMQSALLVHKEQPTVSSREPLTHYDDVPVSPASTAKRHKDHEPCKGIRELAISQTNEDERQRLEHQCKELEKKLVEAENRIHHLERLSSSKSTPDEDRDQLMKTFQEKEARLLAAAAEDHEQEMRFLKREMDVKFQSLHQELEHEREVFEREREYFEQLVAEANARAEMAERQLQRERNKQETAVAQYQKHQDRELKMSTDKLAQTMTLLDEREEQVTKLKAMVQTLQSKLSEHAEGTQLAEDEVEELHHENEELRHHAESLEGKCVELQGRVEQLQADSNKLSELRLELRLLNEARDRERVKSQTETAAAHGNRAQVEEERDGALAQVQDLQQQLAAALADLEIARTDNERVMMARNNLQVALESFQNEREAELALLEDQRRESERVIAAAHAAAMDAMREANNALVREVQIAADASVRHSMDEIQQLEAKLESFRADNAQMRRSLDEAIHRLQATQEDVIDRALMKNILLDWLTKTGTKERRDVLELMASVLHFTEDEKERVHIGSHSGALERVVHTVAAPLPPSKADVEHLAGNTVREKWVNFLLLESE